MLRKLQTAKLRTASNKKANNMPYVWKELQAGIFAEESLVETHYGQAFYVRRLRNEIQAQKRFNPTRSAAHWPEALLL
jgi:hypothetical protein